MEETNSRTAIPPIAPPPFMGSSEFIDTDESDSTMDDSTQSSETETNYFSQNFVPFILMLNPYEFYVVGVVIAVVIAMQLKPAEQDGVGTFIELIGFSIGVIATQGLYLEAIEGKKEEQKLAKESELLKQEVAELKRAVAQLQQTVSGQ